MVDSSATARVERLVRWLEQFKRCFGHRAQLLALRTYVQGVFSDSDRKSMQAMRARVTEPAAHQAFQHFIAHSPWDATAVWRRWCAVITQRRGVLILEGTSFPKQGPHSVGVARQYCGALGKIANCQVATTVALWTGTHAWLLGATLYLPDPWLTAERRLAARIPAAVRFQEKSARLFESFAGLPCAYAGGPISRVAAVSPITSRRTEWGGLRSFWSQWRMLSPNIENEKSFRRRTYQYGSFEITGKPLPVW